MPRAGGKSASHQLEQRCHLDQVIFKRKTCATHTIMKISGIKARKWCHIFLYIWRGQRMYSQSTKVPVQVLLLSPPRGITNWLWNCIREKQPVLPLPPAGPLGDLGGELMPRSKSRLVSATLICKLRLSLLLKVCNLSVREKSGSCQRFHAEAGQNFPTAYILKGARSICKVFF